MDLTKDNFNINLKQLLEHLLHADFVAFDFEFSGIKTRTARTIIEQLAAGPPSFETKPTLQGRYDELREIAEKYTIFQVGVTIAQQDRKTGGYVLRPYNMHLNPLIVHKMDLDRDVTIQSSAAAFLQKNRFEIGKPFSEGVPYLSRDEYRRAIQLESERIDGTNVTDIDFGQLDERLIRYVKAVREQIANWKPYSKSSWLIVHPPLGPGYPFEMLHRRIVHQIVRREFRNLVASTQANTMKILQYDSETEHRHKKQKMDAFFARLSKQNGARWLIEAIAGGDLSDVHVPDLYMDPDKPRWVDLNKARAEFAEIRSRLKERRPVLVGHNQLTDLVYLYRTFIGILPESVSVFAKEIHQLFPMVVDTKYLATHHGIMDASSLQELSIGSFIQHSPKISIAVGNKKYERTSAAHEAGYDSFSTAKLVIKTAAKLAVETDWRLPRSRASEMAASFQTPRPPPVIEPADPHNTLIDFDDEKTEHVPSSARPLREIAYQSRSIFTPLDVSSARALERVVVADPQKLLPKPVDPENSDPSVWELTKDGMPKWMPSWDSEFWTVYGNKIRVNGTEESLLDLAPK